MRGYWKHLKFEVEKKNYKTVLISSADGLFIMRMIACMLCLTQCLFVFCLNKMLHFNATAISSYSLSWLWAIHHPKAITWCSRGFRLQYLMNWEGCLCHTNHNQMLKAWLLTPSHPESLCCKYKQGLYWHSPSCIDWCPYPLLPPLYSDLDIDSHIFTILLNGTKIFRLILLIFNIPLFLHRKTKASTIDCPVSALSPMPFFDPFVSW